MSVGQLTFSLAEVLDSRSKATWPSPGDGPAKDAESHQFALQFARVLEDIPTGILRMTLFAGVNGAPRRRAGQ